MQHELFFTHSKLPLAATSERRFETKQRPHRIMSTDAKGQGAVALRFEPDLSTKQKKGAHKPLFAEVFTQKPVQAKANTHIHLLINPFSGKKKGKGIGEQVKLQLEKEGKTVDIYFSDYSGHLIEIAQGIDASTDDIFAVVGGDGSLSEVITGRMNAQPNGGGVFALIPAGTGNSMAHDLRLTSTEQAVQCLIRGARQNLDLAKVEMVSGLPGSENGQTVRYSHNLVTWGLGVDSTIKAEKMRWMGPMRYDVGILMAIMANNRRQATLTIDDIQMKDDYTLFLIQNRFH